MKNLWTKHELLHALVFYLKSNDTEFGILQSKIGIDDYIIKMENIKFFLNFKACCVAYFCKITNQWAKHI